MYCIVCGFQLLNIYGLYANYVLQSNIENCYEYYYILILFKFRIISVKLIRKITSFIFIPFSTKKSNSNKQNSVFNNYAFIRM